MFKLTVERGSLIVEVLIVIIVIGIIASIVLVLWKDARERTADVMIRSHLISMRTDAKLFASLRSNKYYLNSTENVCTLYPAEPNPRKLFDEALRNYSSSNMPINGTCKSGVRPSSTQTYYFAMVKLKEKRLGGGFNYWCVDSTGASKKIDNGINQSTLEQIDADNSNVGGKSIYSCQDLFTI